jgi:hypothetical protein
MDTLIGLLPIFITQLIYAVFVAQVAKRTGKSATAYVALTLIPILGAFFVIYVLWSTALWVLDSINELKARAPGRATTD